MKILTAVLLTAVCFEAKTAASTLVAAYSFSEGSGTTVSDSSGNGNTGTISGAAWTTSGKYGNALSFNGSNALITIPDATSLHLSAAMTLEAWVNPSTVSSTWRDIVYKGNDNYYLSATSTKSSLPAGAGKFGSTNVETFGTTVLTANTWTYLALTYDGATLRLYVNGTQISSRSQAGNIATSTNPLQIGGDSIYGQYFKGTIDEVRVYNVALTAAQIQTDMNTAIGTPTASSVSLSPTSFNFGNTTVGATSASNAVTLSNTGGAPLTISSISIAGANVADFGQNNACGSSLAAGASCTINVTFSPQALGTRAASLSIADSASGSPQSVSLSGSGIGSQGSTQPHSSVLTWAASSTTNVTQYNVYRCTGSCKPNTLIASVQASANTYTDTSVSPGATYSYATTAVNGNGESTLSNVVAATVPNP